VDYLHVYAKNKYTTNKQLLDS